jgi:hemin uptake protein HemP
MQAERKSQATPPHEAPCAMQVQSTRAVRHINASCLFGSAREVVIAHNGREYRLRITAQQKLILTA